QTRLCSSTTCTPSSSSSASLPLSSPPRPPLSTCTEDTVRTPPTATPTHRTPGATPDTATDCGARTRAEPSREQEPVPRADPVPDPRDSLATSNASSTVPCRPCPCTLYCLMLPLRMARFLERIPSTNQIPENKAISQS
ncbi:hypothetical protein PFISCL1PPCAC_11231, partial [Pristionchus fissidentatus]